MRVYLTSSDRFLIISCNWIILVFSLFWEQSRLWPFGAVGHGGSVWFESQNCSLAGELRSELISDIF